MLRFFRTIRKKLIEQDNVRKYLLYGLGEILLVVIGILIALQVNNWNEGRKDHSLEKEYLTRLKVEALSNITELEAASRNYLNTARFTEQLINYARGEEQEEESINLGRASRMPNFIQTWRTSRSVYDEIISSGNLRILRDLELRELLDEAHSSNQFGYQQLDYWREMSQSDNELLYRYRKSQFTIEDGRIGSVIGLDVEAMQDDEEAIRMLEFWASAQIIFYHGTEYVKSGHQNVAARIDTLLIEN